MSDLEEYLPYAIALIIAIPFLVLLRQFVHTYIELKNKELKLLMVKSNGENKSNAYERMTLFLERMKPSNLIQKFDKGLAPHEFIYLTEKTINEEFEYNVSQQLYISKIAWEKIVMAKRDLIQIMHDSYEELSNPSLEEYKTIFLMKYINENDFIAQTIEDLRRELLIVT